MLTDIQLEQYLNRLSVSPSGRNYIHTVRANQPSRTVGERAYANVCSWVYSEKMGQTISSESHTAEYDFIVLAERNVRIIEIWEQIDAVPIIKTQRNGKEKVFWHTPDFLVFYKDRVVAVEVKERNGVQKLQVKRPSEWIDNEDGGVDYLPAQEYFKSIGLNHEVWVASRDIRFEVANSELALFSRNVQREELNPNSIEKAFEQSFVWSLYDLKNYLNLSSYTPLTQAVDRGDLLIDWRESQLSQPKSCLVVRDENLLGRIKEFQLVKIYDGQELASINIDCMPSEKYASEALKRLELIESNASGRSVRRWRSLLNKGRELGLSEFQSLIPKWFDSGNRSQRLPEIVESSLSRYLMGMNKEILDQSDYRKHKNYVVVAKEVHPSYPPVGRSTFVNRLRSIPPEKIAGKQGGDRKQKALSPPSDPLTRRLKAEIAWQRAAIDHYLADVYLVFFDDGGVPHAMRPWVTAMIDLATRSVLAFSISFQSPSRRHCAKVMRDCVRRHGRLPREIIVDRGSDFRSVYFSALAAHSKINLSLRPKAHSRYGGEVEGLFGEFKKVWLSQRPGNCADFEEARSVDGSKAPKECAVLSAYDFHRELEAFISWRDARPDVISIESPTVRLENDMKNYPFISIAQAYDEEYMLATAVESKSYEFDYQRGIHIQGMWYSSPSLKSLLGKKSSIEVRVDPENPNVVYCLVGKKWVPCYSSRINNYSSLDSISQRIQGLIAIEAYRDRQKIKEAADEELVRIIKDITKPAGSSSRVAFVPTPDAEIEAEVEEENIFTKLKTANIERLGTESWEVKHAWNH
ncbi:hypothetical protein [Aurantivibrio plasticivorans]